MTPTRRDVAVAGHTGALDVALDGLSTADPAVRATAVGALDRLGALDDRRLAAALADPDPGVRRRALQAGARRAGAAVDLCELLNDPDPLVAETAAWALGEQDPPSGRAATSLVATATGHTEHLVREAAIAALGSIGDPVGLEAVLAGLSERATIRRRAVLALAAFDGPAVDAALRRCLDDRDRQVRQAAEDLLDPPA